jgi:uncharacterized membrane protein
MSSFSPNRGRCENGYQQKRKEKKKQVQKTSVLCYIDVDFYFCVFFMLVLLLFFILFFIFLLACFFVCLFVCFPLICSFFIFYFSQGTSRRWQKVKLNRLVHQYLD